MNYFSLIAYFSFAHFAQSFDPATDPAPSGIYATLYHGDDYSGISVNYDIYEPSLVFTPGNNEFQSVNLTGFWIFYEEANYNEMYDGFTLFVHGIQFEYDFAEIFDQKITSFRYAGHRYELNEKSFTLYAGTNFVGEELYGNSSISSFGNGGFNASSLILSGYGCWSFYTESNYQGMQYYFKHEGGDYSSTGETLYYGIYQSIAPTVFQSAQKGC